MNNQLNLLGTREIHYDNMVRMYSNCSVVLENLEITYTLEHQDLSFLQVSLQCWICFGLQCSLVPSESFHLKCT